MTVHVSMSDAENNLLALITLFDSANDNRTSYFYSKLALLEYGGWIECEFDKMIIRLVQKHISDAGSQTMLIKKLESTYGFDYNNNIRPHLINILGTERINKAEGELELVQQRFSQLKSMLGTIKAKRDAHAHTHIGPPTSLPNIDSPRLTLQNLRALCNCMNSLENELEKFAKI